MPGTVFGNRPFVRAGEAGITAEGWVLASGRPVAARILKVGHHGSESATGPAFVAAVDPEIAVIGAGAFNSHGRPSRAAERRLQDSGAKVSSTAESGSVRITATRTGPPGEATDGPVLPVTVPGAALLRTGPDFDGVFEDVNGNQRQDFAAVALCFDQLRRAATDEPVTLFDFNGNGRMDIAGVVWLFGHLRAPLFPDHAAGAATVLVHRQPPARDAEGPVYPR